MMLSNPVLVPSPPHMLSHPQQQQHSPNLLMQDKTPEKMVCGIILNNWKSRHNTKLLMRKALQHNENGHLVEGGCSSIFKSDISGSSCLGIQKKKKTLENKGKFKFHQYQAPNGNGLDALCSNTFSCSAQSIVADVKRSNKVSSSMMTHETNNKQSVNIQNSPYIEKQVVFKFATLPHQTASHNSSSHHHHMKSAAFTTNYASTTNSSNMMYSSCGTSSASSSTTLSSNTSSQSHSRSNQLIMDDDYNNHYQRPAAIHSAPIIHTNSNNQSWWNSVELPQINSCNQATTSTSEPLPSFSQLINTLGI